MTVRFISVTEVEKLHSLTISEHGGSHGLRDRGLLESAVTRAINLSNYEPDASVERLAATLAWGLVKNHAFIDGNKRICFAALLAFLRVNGRRLQCSPKEARTVIWRAAAGNISEEDWTLWVTHSTKLRP